MAVLLSQPPFTEVAPARTGRWQPLAVAGIDMAGRNLRLIGVTDWPEWACGPGSFRVRVSIPSHGTQPCWTGSARIVDRDGIGGLWFVAEPGKPMAMSVRLRFRRRPVLVQKDGG